MTNYPELLKIFPDLISGNPYDITLLANTSALLYEYLDHVNWVGFYIVKQNELWLGPFQGKIACTQIPFSKGVCGTCATQKKTILVPNVHEFKGHIACDSASNSEICLPIIVHNELYAILDIDSPLLNRFDSTDKQNLEALCKIITKELEKMKN